MSLVAPLGGVYQAGTLSGNPVATAAGLATLLILRENKELIYPKIERNAALLEEAYRRAGVPVNRVGSLLSPFFCKSAPRTFADVCPCDREAFARYFNAMLERGEYVAPSQFEAMFVSFAHTSEHIRRTCVAIAESVQEALRAEDERRRR